MLPARLKEEMEHLAEAILAGNDIRKDEELAKHADWVKEFLPRYQEVSKDNITEILHKEIGNVFMEVLEDAGVYKRDEKGQAAFDRFLSSLS